MDIRETVGALCGADPVKVSAALVGMLAIRKGHAGWSPGTARRIVCPDAGTQAYWRGEFAARHAALVPAMVYQATSSELGRVYDPLLAVGGAQACWAALLAAADGRGHRTATARAVDLLVGREPGVPLSSRADSGKWSADAATVAALEEMLGGTPGDLTADYTNVPVQASARLLVACLRPMSADEADWWFSSSMMYTVVGQRVPRLHHNTSGVYATLRWLSQFVLCGDDAAADAAAAQMTAESAGVPPQGRLVDVLDCLYRRQPDIAGDVIAANAANWAYPEQYRADMWVDAQAAARAANVWDAPLHMVAAGGIAAALRLWVATGTGPSTAGVLASAPGVPDRGDAALLALIAASRGAGEPADAGVVALVEAGVEHLGRALLVNLLPAQYRKAGGPAVVTALLRAGLLDADRWLLGRADGYLPPAPGVAAEVLASARRKVGGPAAVEAWRDGVLGLDEVAGAVGQEELDKFVDLFAGRGAVCPPEIAALAAG